MIYVTHDQIEALTFADKVVVMKDGRGRADRHAGELFERPEHTFVGYFIGSPGMNLMPTRRSQASRRWSTAQIFDLGAPTGACRRPARAGRLPAGLYVAVARGRLAGAGAPRRRSRPQASRLRHARAAQQIVATVPPRCANRRRRPNIALDQAHTHVYVNDIRVREQRHDRQAHQQPRLVPVRAGARFRAVLVDDSDDDRGELLGPGHDGRQQFLLEWRCLVSRPAQSRAPRSARASTTRCFAL